MARLLRKSLINRILFIAIIFLIIPLVTLASFLIIKEIRIKHSENVFLSTIILNERTNAFQEEIFQELFKMSEIPYMIHGHVDNNNIQSIEKTFVNTKNQRLLHVMYDPKGEYIIDAATDPSLYLKNVSQWIMMAKKGVMLIWDQASNACYYIYLIPSSQNAWILKSSIEEVFYHQVFDRIINVPYASISILNAQSTVIASTYTDLVGLSIKPVFGKYRYQDNNYIAVQQHLGNTNISLLVSVPRSLNVMDVAYVFTDFLIVLIVFVCVGALGVYILTRRFEKPLSHLIDTMRKMGSGHLEKRYVSDPMGFEINDVGVLFNHMIEDLCKHIKIAEHEKAAKEYYEQELLLGQSVQQSLFPTQLPDVAGLEIAAYCESAREVGGDFYDVSCFDQRCGFVIADAAGKGVFACLYSLILRSLLNSFFHGNKDLEKNIHQANELFCRDTGDTGVFVTAFVGYLDIETYHFYYTNCGHLPAILQKADGSFHLLTTPGMAFGVMEFDHIQVDHIQIEVGDCMIFYTDGVIEAHDDKMEMFGEKRLIELIKREHNTKTSDEMVKRIVSTLKEFAHGAVQYDDLTLVIFKRTR